MQLEHAATAERAHAAPAAAQIDGDVGALAPRSAPEHETPVDVHREIARCAPRDELPERRGAARGVVGELLSARVKKECVGGTPLPEPLDDRHVGVPDPDLRTRTRALLRRSSPTGRRRASCRAGAAGGADRAFEGALWTCVARALGALLSDTTRRNARPPRLRPAARPRLVVCDARALRDAGGRRRRRRMQRTRLARPRPVRGRVRARGARATVGELLRHGAVEVPRVALALLAAVQSPDAEGRLRRTLHARVRVAQRQLRLPGRTRPTLSCQHLVPGAEQARQHERPRLRQWRVPIPNRYTAKAKLCFCKNNKRRIIMTYESSPCTVYTARRSCWA